MNQAYIRPEDGLAMVEIAPHQYLNIKSAEAMGYVLNDALLQSTETGP